MIKNVFEIIFLLVFFVGSLSCSSTNGSDKNDSNADSLAADKQAEDTINLENYNRYYNDVARFYAGIEQLEGSSIQDMDTNAAWQRHHKDFTIFYDSIERTWFPPVIKFRIKELYDVNKEIKTLYYPFSGPDFVHANLFFPEAENIIMCGLERVGEVPNLEELSDARMDKFFKAVRTSLDSIFAFGYFMTNDMNKDFSRSYELRGLTPIFMLFMSKAGYTVLDVTKVTINKQTEIKEIKKGDRWTDSPWDTFISGVKIKYYMKGSNKIRHLYYFSHNASDKHLVNTPEFTKWLRKQDMNVTFLKAASYLMGSFDGMRNVALDKTKYLFQTDSGIPIRFLPQSEWEYKLWGQYKRTIGVFSWAFQRKLKEIYETDTTVTPLKFGIGYGFRYDESNLMLFTRKKSEK